MSPRPEPRLQADLRVRVWGMAAGQRPFFQNAQAHNISSHGALLSGIEHELTAGEIIGVQYNNKKARFRVVWVIDAGQLQKMQVGVQIMEGQECPWPQELKPLETEAAAEAAAQSAADKRRRAARHKISFPLDLLDERGARAHMQTNATDISGRGCYVETIMPLAKGTPLKIAFWIDSEKVNTSGMVRACDPGVGMGIEFTGLGPEDQERLQRHIEKLDKGFASGASPASES